MPPAARVTDTTTHGSPLAPGPGSVNVLIGNLPAWRAMIDQHACPMVSISGADGVGSVMMGSPTVLINNQMACRLGDIVMEKPGLVMGPVNPIIMGEMTVNIGEVGMGGIVTPFGAAMAAAKRQGAAYSSVSAPGTLLGGQIQGIATAGSAEGPDGGSSQDDTTSATDDQDSHQKLEWVSIRLVNDAGEPLSEEEMHGSTTDGQNHQTNISAGLLYSEIPGGPCKFTFPKFYDEMKNWMPDTEDGEDL